MNVLYFGAVAGIVSNIPWTCCFIFLQYFGIRLYILTKKEECSLVQKRVGNRFSEMGDGEKPQGYALGLWYLIHLTVSDGEYRVWMVATKESYKALIQDNQVMEIATGPMGFSSNQVHSTKRLSILQRSGSYSNPWFRKREIPIIMTPHKGQTAIIDQILAHQTQHHHTVAYLWGPPGTGKSMVGIFLANQINGIYCNNVRLWEPNITMNLLYSEYDTSETCPLVVIFEEFDIPLLKINEGIEPHKNLPIAISDKSGWNRLFDEIQRGLYPHLIVLLTSNKDPDYINSIDPSYIRKGRVDMIFEMNALIKED